MEVDSWAQCDACDAWRVLPPGVVVADETQGWTCAAVGRSCASARVARRESAREEEASGSLVQRSLGGVVWYEAPRAAPAPQHYRPGRPAGTHTHLDEPFGHAPARGRKRPAQKIAAGLDWLEDDEENDLVGRRAMRTHVATGRRVSGPRVGVHAGNGSRRRRGCDVDIPCHAPQ